MLISDPGRQKRPTRKEKNEEILSYELLDVLSGGAGGFSCSLNALHEGLRKAKILHLEKIAIFPTVKICPPKPVSGFVPNSSKAWIRNPDSVYPKCCEVR
jgi:hypothetical protein